MHDMTKQERAERAARLLSDPLFKDMFDAVYTAIHQQVDACPVRDVEGLQALLLQLTLLKSLRANVVTWANDGKVEAFYQQQERK